MADLVENLAGVLCFRHSKLSLTAYRRRQVILRVFQVQEKTSGRLCFMLEDTLFIYFIPRQTDRETGRPSHSGFVLYWLRNFVVLMQLPLSPINMLLIFLSNLAFIMLKCYIICET